MLHMSLRKSHKGPHTRNICICYVVVLYVPNAIMSVKHSYYLCNILILTYIKTHSCTVLFIKFNTGLTTTNSFLYIHWFGKFEQIKQAKD